MKLEDIAIWKVAIASLGAGAALTLALLALLNWLRA